MSAPVARYTAPPVLCHTAKLTDGSLSQARIISLLAPTEKEAEAVLQLLSRYAGPDGLPQLRQHEGAP